MPQLFGSSELLEDVHNRDLCIGCGACVELCPYFKNFRGKTAQLFPCSLPQGRCFAYCPKAEVDLEELYQQIRQQPYEGTPLGPYRQIVAARAGSRMVPGRFQGGGTVSALAALALKKGMLDAVILTQRNDLIPAPAIVTDWRRVVDFSGSKFMAAPTLAGLNSAVQQGYGKIGLVGTPCQMTAAAQMRVNPLEKEAHKVPIALTIGLFCNWSLDTRQLNDLLEQRVDPAAICAMDIPPPPANMMVLETASEKIEISLSEIKPLIPHTCFTCLDMTSELADLSVGMYEGRQKWNTLIVRSETGDRLLQEAVREDFLQIEPLSDGIVDHLSRAAAAKKERSMRMLVQRGLINTANGTRAAVRMPAKARERILPSKA